MWIAAYYSLENTQALNRRSPNVVVGENKDNMKKIPLLSSMKREQHLCGGDAFGGTENKSSWAQRCSIIASPLAGIVNKQLPLFQSTWPAQLISPPPYFSMKCLPLPLPSPPSLLLHISLSFPFILWSPWWCLFERWKSHHFADRERSHSFVIKACKFPGLRSAALL